MKQFIKDFTRGITMMVKAPFAVSKVAHKVATCELATGIKAVDEKVMTRRQFLKQSVRLVESATHIKDTVSYMKLDLLDVGIRAAYKAGKCASTEAAMVLVAIEQYRKYKDMRGIAKLTTLCAKGHMTGVKAAFEVAKMI